MSSSRTVEIAPVTPDRWADLADLFERRGPRGGLPITANCWCMWWRQRTGDRDRNREAMHRLVAEGREPGLLAYDGPRPVGWVSVAPREDYGQLARSRNLRPETDEPEVWAIVCFYVEPAAKRRGVASELLAAAVEHAVGRGARAVEAYPHVRGDYMGSPEMFDAAGFQPVREAGKRVVMRYVPKPRK